jgi:polyphosphate kinase 2 (PPK2 family)
MLERTDRSTARWHVVAGDDKRSARVSVIEIVCAAIEAELTARGVDLEPAAAP